MADQKISQLTPYSGLDVIATDLLPIVDTTNSQTKSITFDEFTSAVLTSVNFLAKTGGSMVGNLNFEDNYKATFGDGSDFEIYHDGTYSYVGPLKFDANGDIVDPVTINAALDVDGIATITGDLNLGDELNLTATSNNFVDHYGTMRMRYYDGAAFYDTMSISSTATVFNDTGRDLDFRIESDTNTHAFFLQGSDGNVGIGTSSPGSTTHIAEGEATAYNGAATDGQLSAGSTLFVQQTSGSNTAVSQLVFQPRSGFPYNRIVNSGGSAPFMAFSTNNTERVRITSTGNVGIGTDDPTNTLTVSAGSGNGIFVQDNNNTGASPFVKVRGNRSDGNVSQCFSGKLLLEGYQTSAAVVDTKNLGTVAFGGNHTDGSAGNILYPASISGTSEGTFSNATTMPTALTFHTGSTGRADTTPNVTFGTERLRITSSGDVGIGTDDPAEKLEVKGNIITTGGTTNSRGMILGHQNNINSSYIGRSENGLVDTNNRILFRYDDNSLKFDVNGSDRMRIDSDGVTKAQSYAETYVTLSGTTPTITCTAGNFFGLNTTGNTTFTFASAPASGTGYGFSLRLTAGGTHTLTWPASVKWPGGTAPDNPASGETNIYAFVTHDGGTTWYGMVGGEAFS